MVQTQEVSIDASLALLTGDSNMFKTFAQWGGLKECTGVAINIYQYLWARNQHGESCRINLPPTVNLVLRNLHSNFLQMATS
jgi:hypothetical protein